MALIKHPSVRMAFLLFVAAVTAAFVITYIGFHASVSEDQRQKQTVLNSVLAERLDAVNRTTADYAQWDEILQNVVLSQNPFWISKNLGAALTRTFGLDQVYVIGGNGEVLHVYGGDIMQAAALMTQPVFVRAREATVDAPGSGPKVFGGYVGSGQGAYFLSVGALTYQNRDDRPRRPEERSVLVLLKKIDADSLTDIARNYNLKDLSLTAPEGRGAGEGRIGMAIHQPEGSLFRVATAQQELTYATYLRDSLLPILIIVLSVLYLAIQVGQKTRALEATNHQLNDLNATLEAKVAHQTRTVAAERDRAEEANRAKSVFLSSMSHELRTPLNGILGFSQILLGTAEDPLSKRQREQIGLIQTSGEAMLEIVNDVLDLARVESGNEKYVPEYLNPRQILDECVDVVRPLAAEKRVRLVAVPGAVPDLCVDRVKLKQVLLNLLGNGIKYNHLDGTLTYGCRKGEDSTVVLFVDDTGVGIPPDEIDRIFDPFYRCRDVAQQIPGTGVGLSIVKRNVTLMGGTVWVDSLPGDGTRFTVRLPVGDADKAG